METLEVSATLTNLEKMLDFAVGCAKQRGFEGEPLNQVRLACEEALVNVINYAYPGKEGTVEISCASRHSLWKNITITISDAGIPFDPLSLPEPDTTLPMEQRKIGGLGIFMIRKIMDYVTYRRENGHNILTLIKTE